MQPSSMPGRGRTACTNKPITLSQHLSNTALRVHTVTSGKLCPCVEHSGNTASMYACCIWRTVDVCASSQTYQTKLQSVFSSWSISFRYVIKSVSKLLIPSSHTSTKMPNETSEKTPDDISSKTLCETEPQYISNRYVVKHKLWAMCVEKMGTWLL
jgi:hypothetical protein